SYFFSDFLNSNHRLLCHSLVRLVILLNYHLSVINYHLFFSGITAFGFSSVLSSMVFGFAVCSAKTSFPGAGMKAIVSVCIFLASCNSFSIFFFNCIESTLLIL